jgi:ubiquinone/menaquinone biosynthesis C-methylase UbiE
MTDQHHTAFTPALGSHQFTAYYDRVIAIFTRERRWRMPMLAELAPRDGETIVDIGSGTGTFALMVKQAAPGVRLVAVDPDPVVRDIAEAKASAANTTIEFVTAMGGASIDGLEQGSVDKVVNSLVLHQCPIPAKKEILANALRLLKPGGRLLISDFGAQSTWLMRLLFNLVRIADGYEDTKANKDGRIPQLITEAGFERVQELRITPTLTGSISLYSAWKAA